MEEDEHELEEDEDEETEKRRREVREQWVRERWPWVVSCCSSSCVGVYSAWVWDSRAVPGSPDADDDGIDHTGGCTGLKKL